MGRKKQAAKLKAGRTPSSLPDPIKAIKQQAQALAANVLAVTPGGAEEADPPDEVEVETAVDVLTVLAANPALLSRKQYKDLKRVGWEFGKVLADQGSGAGNTIHSQISHLLSISHYRRALILLFELYVNKTPTKLGSLQRWVRDCDATSRPGEVLTEEEWEERQDVLKCLDMVLRVCGSDKETTAGSSTLAACPSGPSKGVVRKMQAWDVRSSDRRDEIQDTEALWQLVEDGYQRPSTDGADGVSFRAVQKTPGALRRPPNVYDSTVVASSNPTPIDCSSSSRPTFSVSHPSIPSCSMVLNALSPGTCRSIISSANAIGWEADQAAGGSAVDKTSVLAHNVVWLADEDFVGQLYERIRPFVHDSVPSEKDGRPLKVRGINRRFRVYRYGSRQVYRPHIDGAWPAAGLDPVTGEYLHDSSPADDPLSSRFTILIYLNSDINTSSPELPVPGATTFFMPCPDSIGRLLAFPIAPVQGAVLVFPHGDAHGALLHEGSPVGDGGWKVVIRTDLLYESDTLTR